eukprot:SAG25_NODE_384_length_8785_cov_7.011628_9_plen_74_part_00
MQTAKIKTPIGELYQGLLNRGENGKFMGEQSSAQDLRKLLELISLDVNRDDWLRVGNFLKHQTHVSGFELWSE